ncbi:MAG: DUF1566 domain-containing protein [Nitrospinae bacterium]|nr:DUF1566 domain-containing protein [Nitrospinota bacterium]
MSLWGRSGWHLPSKDELKLLWDNAGSKQDVRSAFFPSKDGFYWASDAFTTDPSVAWNVSFNHRLIDLNKKGDTYYARCVRR